MTESIKKFNTGYTLVLNAVLYDKNISLRAKGLYAYLFSKPDGWNFHINIMEEELKESRNQIYSAIKELIESGYIIRRQVNEKGVFGGIVYEFVDIYRLREKPCTEKTVYGKTSTHNNTYISSNTDLKEKDINKFISKKKSEKFIKPTIEEITAYCQERNNGIDAETFYYFYESKGWKVGSSPMKSWKAAVITWEKKNPKTQSTFNMEDWLNEQD